jgi:hypothetical protein
MRDGTRQSEQNPTAAPSRTPVLPECLRQVLSTGVQTCIDVSWRFDQA